MYQLSESSLFYDSFFTKLQFHDNKRWFKSSMRILLLLFFLNASHSVIKSQNSAIDLSYISGKFEPSVHPDFIEIDKKYARTVDAKKKMYLHKETYAQLKRMLDAAAKDNIIINVLSATRNFKYQKNIWEEKWHKYKNEPTDKARSKKILEYSAMPSASRHHWGTDVDLAAMTNAYFNRGEGLKIYNWLQAHATEYGFCQPYTANRQTGYNEEKWHWTYLPLAKKCQTFAQTHLTDADFKGFLGAKTAVELQIVKNYIIGINMACQPN